jgi:competence protein ComEA
MFKKLLVLLMALVTSIAFAAVDVNSADATQLDGVKGIGPVLSAKIVAARKSGNFKDWNDFVQRVPGVGDKSAVKLSAAGLTVNGSTFNGVPAAAAAPAVPKPEKVSKAAAPVVPATPAAPPATMTMAKPAAAPAPTAIASAASAKPTKAEKAAAAKEAKAEKAAKKAEAKAAKAASKAEAAQK